MSLGTQSHGFDSIFTGKSNCQIILVRSLTHVCDVYCFNFLHPLYHLLQPLLCFLCSFRRELPSLYWIISLFFPFYLSKNFCWKTSCGSRVLSNHALKTERDSPRSTADNVVMSLFLSKNHLKSYIVIELWTVTLPVPSVWDRDWAWSLMKHNFGIPNTVRKLTKS